MTETLIKIEELHKSWEEIREVFKKERKEDACLSAGISAAERREEGGII